MSRCAHVILLYKGVSFFLGGVLLECLMFWRLAAAAKEAP